MNLQWALLTKQFLKVKNPESRFCAGGSGGSAACVSAELAPVATATDTGGSIRQPRFLWTR